MNKEKLGSILKRSSKEDTKSTLIEQNLDEPVKNHQRSSRNVFKDELRNQESLQTETTSNKASQEIVFMQGWKNKKMKPVKLPDSLVDPIVNKNHEKGLTIQIGEKRPKK